MAAQASGVERQPRDCTWLARQTTRTQPHGPPAAGRATYVDSDRLPCSRHAPQATRQSRAVRSHPPAAIVVASGERDIMNAVIAKSRRLERAQPPVLIRASNRFPRSTNRPSCRQAQSPVPYRRNTSTRSAWVLEAREPVAGKNLRDRLTKVQKETPHRSTSTYRSSTQPAYLRSRHCVPWTRTVAQQQVGLRPLLDQKRTLGQATFLHGDGVNTTLAWTTWHPVLQGA